MTDPGLDELVARRVFRRKLVTATDKRPMTWNGCRVSDGVYLDTGKKSAWGRVVRNIPKYSSSIADAWLVVEAMERKGYCWTVESEPGNCIRAEFAPEEHGPRGWTGSSEEDITPRAICLAALRALGVKVTA